MFHLYTTGQQGYDGFIFQQKLQELSAGVQQKS